MEEITDEPLYRDRVCGIDIFLALAVIPDPAQWQEIKGWASRPDAQTQLTISLPITYMYYAIRQIALSALCNAEPITREEPDFNDTLRLFEQANDSMERIMSVLTPDDVRSSFFGDGGDN